MIKKLLFALLVILTGCTTVKAFPPAESTGTFSGVYSPSWDDFSWSWSDYADQKLNVSFGVGQVTNVLFRLAAPAGGSYYLTVVNGAVVIGTTNTAYTASIPRTNIPPNRTYFGEFLAAGVSTSIVDGVTNFVYDPTRVLARGKVTTYWSVYSSTNAANWTPVNVYYTYDTNITFVEYDPIWLAASTNYATLTGLTALASSALSSSYWASADSTTNYALRTTYNTFTTTYASADATTNYANRVAYMAFTSAYVTADATTNYMQRDVQIASNALYTVDISSLNTNVAARLSSNVWATSASTTNYELRTWAKTTNDWQTLRILSNQAAIVAASNSLYAEIINNNTSATLRLLSNVWAVAESTTNSTPYTTYLAYRATDTARVAAVEGYTNRAALALASSVWAVADSATNYVKRTGDMLTGSLTASNTAFYVKNNTNTLVYLGSSGGAGDYRGSIFLSSSYGPVNGAGFTVDAQGRLLVSGNPFISQGTISTAYMKRAIGSSMQFAGEMLTNGAFATDTGWAVGGSLFFDSDHYVLNSGNTGTITPSNQPTLAKGGMYQVVYSIGLAATGAVNVAVGGWTNYHAFTGPFTGTSICHVMDSAQGFNIALTAPNAKITLDDVSLKRHTNGHIWAAQTIGAPAVYGTFYGDGSGLTNVTAIETDPIYAAMRDGNYVNIGGGATGGVNYGVAIGKDADGRSYGTAIGAYANGNDGVALGHHANGSDVGIAIGPYAYGRGEYRIAIGERVTNSITESIAARGTLYLDGGSNIYMRSSFGTGAWSSLASTLAGDGLAIVGGKFVVTGEVAAITNCAWSGITDTPDTLEGYGITNALSLSGGELHGNLELGIDSSSESFKVKFTNGSYYATLHLINSELVLSKGAAVYGLATGTPVYGQAWNVAGTTLAAMDGSSLTNINVTGDGGATGIVLTASITNFSYDTNTREFTIHAAGGSGGMDPAIASNSFVVKAGDTMTGALTMSVPNPAVAGSTSIVIRGTGNYASDGTFGVLIANTTSTGLAGSVVIGSGVSGGAGAISIGIGCVANGGSSVGIGSTIKAYGASSISIGPNANAPAGSCVAIGSAASCQNASYQYAVALGANANGYGVEGIGIGYKATAGEYGVVIGSEATDGTYGSSVVIGKAAVARGNSVVIGRAANANTSVAGGDVVIGHQASAFTRTNAISLGYNVTNQINDSARIRGSLYLDGADTLAFRTNFGSGNWNSAGIYPTAIGGVHLTNAAFYMTLAATGVWYKVTNDQWYLCPGSHGFVADGYGLKYTNDYPSGPRKFEVNLTLVTDAANETYRLCLGKGTTTNATTANESEMPSLGKSYPLGTSCVGTMVKDEVLYFYLWNDDTPSVNLIKHARIIIN